MPESEPSPAMRLLLDIERDDDSRAEALLELLGSELHAIAAGYLHHERANHTLQPTALVNEAYLRLIDSTVVRSEDKGRFMSVAARAMRRVLIDSARARKAQHRGSGEWERVTLHPELASASVEDVDVLVLDEALEKFAGIDERAAQVVELRFFCGLSIEETAAALGVSDRTVGNDWFTARCWLGRELGQVIGE